MDDLSRAEYPAMLAHLQPAQASQTLAERLKRVNKINNEIADWLQERRKVEEQYVAGLRKLLLFKVPNAASELGVFQSPWDKVLQSVDSIAASHHLYVTRIEKDAELPLRNFQGTKEMVNMHTFAANLQSMARELEDAREKADKLSRKGGKANAQKVDAANSRLDGASQQWESQAPFIFESLQALDEQRTNHLRDVLTQLQTHEVDQASRTQASAEDVLNLTLEISTSHEIQSFAQRITAGKPRIEKRGPPTRQSSTAAGSTTGSNIRPPSSSAGGHEDDASDHSGRNEPHTESKLRSRIGTMLGRRRQSIHGGFGQLSSSKSSGPFSRGLSSSHGRSVSPRASSHNLTELHRLSSLAESPNSPNRPETSETNEKPPKPSHEATNGVSHTDGTTDTAMPLEERAAPAGLLNGTAEDIFDTPHGPPSSQPAKDASQAGVSEPGKDSEGFTVPAAMNDPISQAEREAAAAGGADDADQFFKLNIQKEPLAEEDADAKQAAMSNVANTLSAAMPSRKSGTIRGRRDVRNTIYMPTAPVLPPLPSPAASAASGPTTAPGATAAFTENQSVSVVAGPVALTTATAVDNVTFPSLSPPSTLSSKPSAVAALASEASIAATSDTQSVRSATSLSSLAHFKHPDMPGPGLNTSILETVNASFEGGELKSVKMSGEIAFSYNVTADINQKEHETVRIDNFHLLDVIGPNRIFVSNTAHPDEFILDTSHLSSRTTTAFSYRLHAESDSPASLSSFCPLIIKLTWKPTTDHKLGLLLQYRLNPAAFTSTTTTRSLTLHNLIFVTSYEGRASAAQTRPSGTHLKDKHLVYWRLNDVTLSIPESGDEEWSKIVCRIVPATAADGTTEMLQPGHVEARWEYMPLTAPDPTTGRIDASRFVSVSRLAEDKGKDRAVGDEDDGDDDPFADDKGPLSPRVNERRWDAVPVVRKVVSGRYEAK